MTPLEKMRARAAAGFHPAAVKLCTFTRLSNGVHQCNGAAPSPQQGTITGQGTTPAAAYFAYRDHFKTISSSNTRNSAQ